MMGRKEALMPKFTKTKTTKNNDWVNGMTDLEVIETLEDLMRKHNPLWGRLSDPCCHYNAQDVQHIISIDARKHGISFAGVKEGTRLDTAFSYMLYLRVYSLMLMEYSPLACMAFRQQVTRYGLLDVISYLKDCADAYIQHRTLAQLLPTKKVIGNQIICDVIGAGVPEGERVVLQLLRFGKRFTVANAFTADRAYEELLRCNRKCASSQWAFRNDTSAGCYRSSHFRADLRRRMERRLARTFSKYGKGRNRESAYDFLRSKNAVKDACTCAGCKEIVFMRERGFMRYSPYTLGMIGITPGADLPNHKLLGDPVFYPRERDVNILCVPKTATTGRCISPEEVVAASDQMHIRYEMERGWKTLNVNAEVASGVNYYYQRANQEMAMTASVDGSLATIDLHSASDLVHLGFLDLFPEAMRSDMLLTRPTHFNINGKRYKSYIVSFMGCGFTYSLMSALLECILLETIEFVRVWNPDVDDRYSVVGDDIICSVDVAQTFMEILEIFGLEPNAEKSFFDPQPGFRESCGGDYWKGYYLTSAYWPRKLLTLQMNEKVTYDRHGSFETTSVDTLISLQHAISAFSVDAAELLGRVIINVWPEVSEDMYGGVQQSVWSRIPSIALRTVPHVEPTSSFPWKLVQTDLETKEVWYENGDPRVREHHSTTHVIRRSSDAEALRKHALKCKLKENPYTQIEDFLYLQYLEHGPHYEDALSELLHVSTRRTAEDYFSDVQYKRF
jgi:hypothetical protein